MDNLDNLGDHPAFRDSGLNRSAGGPSSRPPSPTRSHSDASSRTLHHGHGSAADHLVHHHHDKKHHHGHHHHAHRFNKGIHRFPFNFTIPGSLPATVKTPNGVSAIVYEMKATVTRQGGFGVFGGKWTAKKTVNIIRGLLPEAAEYTQTLEIENTWPGKIMYNITLPHKAYCAGESVPV